MPRRLSRSLTLLALTASTAYAQPTTAAVMAPLTTTSAVTTAGGTIRYHATVGEFALTDSSGRLRATIFSTTYLRDDVPDLSRRPIVFAFNGGPGASSTPLHLGALGPQLRAPTPDSSGNRPIVENPLTLLDAADLVFIDPVGTGFSREIPAADSGAYYSPTGDARAVLKFINAWLDAHGRRGSPVYICGESYGGFRLATMLQNPGSLQIAGIILVSPMLDATAIAESAGNDLPYIFSVPAMAAAAWHHGKALPQLKRVEDVFAQARDFALGEYALALLKGSRLPSAQRTRVVAQLHRFTGLSAATIIASNLRIEADTFVTSLLRDKGLRIGRLDARASGKASELNTRRPPLNDPSMHMTSGSANSLNSYFHGVLGVPGSREYVSLALDVNGRWNWNPDSTEDGFYHNPTPNIGRVMRAQPQMRVLLLGGYYDLAAPILSAQYALDHGGVPPDRVTLAALDGGHSMYETDDSRMRFNSTLRRFITSDAKR